MSTKIDVSPTVNETIVSLCVHLIGAIETVAKARPDQSAITIGLSGGSLIQQLSGELPNHKSKLEPYTDRLRFLFCDERYAPLDHSDNTYYGFLSHQFFSKLNIDHDKAVLKIKPELPLDECAQDYANQLEQVIDKQRQGFDILLLGIGPDGHTCSLFPDHKSFRDCFDPETRKRLVISVRDSPKPPPQRVTLTLDYINNSRFLFFCAVGDNKATMLRTILTDKDLKIPSANVKPNHSDGQLIWFLDKAAAQNLN